MRWLPILILLSVPLPAETGESEPGSLEEAVRLFQAQDLEAAEALLLALREQQGENAEAAYYLGRVYLAQGRSQDAVQAIEQSTKLDPESAVCRFWLAEALVQRIGEVPAIFKLGIAGRMRVAYEKAVELDPGHLAARVAVARYHSEAPPIAGGDPARAERELDEIRLRDPALAHVARGLIHEQLGRLEPAAEELAIAIRVDPESVAAWREAGLFYQRRQRWLDARQAFSEVLAREPADPIALYETARTAITISDLQLERAEEALAAYLQLEPGPEPIVLSEGEPPLREHARERLAAVRGRRSPEPANLAETAAEESGSARTTDRIDWPLPAAARPD